jgi:hypothetical protein
MDSGAVTGYIGYVECLKFLQVSISIRKDMLPCNFHIIGTLDAKFFLRLNLVDGRKTSQKHLTTSDAGDAYSLCNSLIVLEDSQNYLKVMVTM